MSAWENGAERISMLFWLTIPTNHNCTIWHDGKQPCLQFPGSHTWSQNLGKFSLIPSPPPPSHPAFLCTVSLLCTESNENLGRNLETRPGKYRGFFSQIQQVGHHWDNARQDQANTSIPRCINHWDNVTCHDTWEAPIPGVSGTHVHFLHNYSGCTVEHISRTFSLAVKLVIAGRIQCPVIWSSSDGEQSCKWGGQVSA